MSQRDEREWNPADGWPLPATNEQREVCEVCEQPYTVWFAPSDVWNMVMRSGGSEAYSFVCPRCFTIDAERVVEGITGWLVTPCNDGPVRTASQVVIRE